VPDEPSVPLEPEVAEVPLVPLVPLVPEQTPKYVIVNPTRSGPTTESSKAQN